MTTIVTKNGSGAPLASDLVQGELAVDLTNKRLYTENASGTVIEIGTSPSTIDINAGTIDGTVIGGSSAAAGTFTTFTSTGIDDNATSTAITIDASENVLVGGTSQSGTANKVMVKSADKFGLSIIDTTAQATGVGGALNLGGNYRTSGDAQAFTRIAALKDNSTDSNFAYSMGFYTTPNGGTFTERMRIDSSGNVGIGTSSNIAGINLEIKKAGAYLGLNSTTAGYSLVRGYDNGTERWSIGQIGFGGADGMAFYTGSSNTERMRIDSSGNVGIGETAPSRALDIKSASPLNINTTSNNHIHFQVNDVTTGQYASTSSLPHQLCDSTGSFPRLVVDSSGDVGIGVAPVAGYGRKLQVHSAAGGGASVHITDSTTGSTASDGLELITFNSAAYLWNREASFMSFGTSATERMRIDSDGRLLLGTTSSVSVTGGERQFQISGTNGVTSSAVIRRSQNSSGAPSLSFAKDRGSVSTVVASGDALGAIYFAGSDGTDLTNDSAAIISYADGTPSSNNMPGVLVFSTNGGSTSSTERMRIDSSGNVGIGTTPNQQGSTKTLHIQNANGATLKLEDGTDEFDIQNVGGTGFLVTRSANPIAFYTDSSERMRIDSSGNLLVGTTSFSAGTVGFRISADGRLTESSTGATTSKVHRAFYNPNGQVGSITTNGTATAYNISSDQRLKENIVDAPAGNIDAIRVRSFDWKADGSHQTYGMVAQELVDVAPEAVTQGETEDDMWAVDYSKLVPMMIKEIQDLKAEVAALKGA